MCIEIWNLTQNWIKTNSKARESLDPLMNARLQLMYARQATDEDEKQEEGHAKTNLTTSEKSKLKRIVVLEAEKLSECVEHLDQIVGKFRKALARLPSWRQLCPKPGPTISHILNTLEKSLPAIIEMYSREVETRRRALLDLATFEHPAVFTAINLTFQYEPFIDQDLVGCLYSLVATKA